MQTRYSLLFLLTVLLMLTALALSTTVNAADETIVAADQGVTITEAEFKAVLNSMGDGLKAQAASDLGDRLELISGMLESRKLAAKADNLDPEDPDYWKLQFALIAAKQRFMFDRELATFQISNPEPLAREWYRTQKDKYARIPETRASSHILLASPPGQPRGELREKARGILEELRAGADFEAMVEQHSQDPNSKRRGGALQDWIRLGDPSITPPYSGALFEIEEVGGYSEVTDSQFGLHIIRLDGIREAGYKEYEEVRNDILNDIVAEFRKLARSALRARYRISDEAFIDGPAMEALFAPYRKN